MCELKLNDPVLTLKPMSLSMPYLHTLQFLALEGVSFCCSFYWRDKCVTAWLFLMIWQAMLTHDGSEEGIFLSGDSD